VVNDGLRLSQGMTRKNALAGLWWGGGKGVIPMTRELAAPEYRQRGSAQRRALFRAYGRFIASLNGIYYTAEDVGTYTEDMNEILAVNRFITCVGSELGGSGNPSPHTARGVFAALEVASKFLHREGGFRDVRVAVQGAGNVGWPLIQALHEAGARLWVTDTNRQALDRLGALGPRVQVVEDPEAIYDIEAEIFVPCATGASVSARTIPRLRRSGVRLICGAANNILERDEDAETLKELGILFVPDYVCNRLGIVNCANEPYGYLLEDIDRAVAKVGPDVLEILESARRRGITPLAEANERADRKAGEIHPVLEHRGQKLLHQLVSSQWASPLPKGEGLDAA
jgi:glutamate dehydrogenase/leucine dehydrogenase